MSGSQSRIDLSDPRIDYDSIKTYNDEFDLDEMEDYDYEDDDDINSKLRQKMSMEITNTNRIQSPVSYTSKGDAAENGEGDDDDDINSYYAKDPDGLSVVSEQGSPPRPSFTPTATSVYSRILSDSKNMKSPEFNSSSTINNFAMESPASSSSNVIIDNGRSFNVVPGSGRASTIPAKEDAKSQSSPAADLYTESPDTSVTSVWDEFAEFRDKIQRYKSEDKDIKSPSQSLSERISGDKRDSTYSERTNSVATSATLLHSIPGSKFSSVSYSAEAIPGMEVGNNEASDAMYTDETVKLKEDSKENNGHAEMADERAAPMETPKKNIKLITKSLSTVSLKSPKSLHNKPSIQNWDPEAEVLDTGTPNQANKSPSMHDINIQTSPASLSRQSLAERHLLEVFQRAKRSRDGDILSVLLERVVSDTMRLYNQPGSDTESIDRVCLSLSDFIVQFMDSTGQPDIMSKGGASIYTGQASAGPRRTTVSWSVPPNQRSATSMSTSRPSSSIYSGSPAGSWYDSPISRGSSTPQNLVYDPVSGISRPSTRQQRRLSTLSRAYEPRY